MFLIIQTFNSWTKCDSEECGQFLIDVHTVILQSKFTNTHLDINVVTRIYSEDGATVYLPYQLAKNGLADAAPRLIGQVLKYAVTQVLSKKNSPMFFLDVISKKNIWPKVGYKNLAHKFRALIFYQNKFGLEVTDTSTLSPQVREIFRTDTYSDYPNLAQFPLDFSISAKGIESIFIECIQYYKYLTSVAITKDQMANLKDCLHMILQDMNVWPRRIAELGFRIGFAVLVLFQICRSALMRSTNTPTYYARGVRS